MLNLKQRTNSSVQLPDDQDAALYFNNEEKLVLKNSEGTIEEVITTATEPNPRVFKGLISQVGTDAPDMDIMINNLSGSLSTARSIAGRYTITASAPIFTEEKTFVIIGQPGDGLTSGSFIPYAFYSAEVNSETTIIIETGVWDGTSDFPLSDDALWKNPISIEVYE